VPRHDAGAACVAAGSGQVGLMTNKFNDDEMPAPSATDEQGEGNRDADRRYREATERYAKSGAVEPAAKEARRAVDDPEQRDDLKKAEDIGKSHRADTDLGKAKR
jgi:hypothetical protein